MKYLIGAASFLIILVLGFLIVIYSGLYNMSTASHHTRITLWAINTLVDNSIKHYAKDTNIKSPDLSDTALIRKGFTHYNEMCAACHGAPGVEQLASGFYPHPPKLVRAAKDWTPEQLFWIIKNGLKMSAMPAFDSTLDDERIWAVVAFTQKLPDITKEQYQMLLNQTKGETVNKN